MSDTIIAIVIVAIAALYCLSKAFDNPPGAVRSPGAGAVCDHHLHHKEAGRTAEAFDGAVETRTDF